MADGSITFSTELDNKRLEKELIKTKREVEKLEESISTAEAKKSPLVEQAQELETKMRAAREEAERAKEAWVSGVAGADGQQSEAVQRAAALAAEHEKVVAQIDKIDAKLLPAYEKLDGMKDKAGGIAENIRDASTGTNVMGKALDRASAYVERMGKHFATLVRRVVVFSLLSSAIRSMRDAMGKMILANDDAAQAVARLKGALLTLAQPLLNVIIPAFTAFVNVLTRVVTAIASLFATIFGTTVKQSASAAKALNAQGAAYKKTGAAAQKASKQLAAFDEINQITNDSGADAGGAAVPDGAAEPLFDFNMDDASTNFEKILNVVKLIGAALLAWKLSGSMEELFSGRGLMRLIGAFMALDGAIGFVRNTFDAWKNGLDWDNFSGMIGRAAELVTGLFLLLGKVGGAIGLIVTGLVSLATAFRDADSAGWNLQNTLLAVAGLLATGIGIGILVGSWIPALIAAIGAALLAITIKFGDGEKLIADLKKVVEGFKDFFVGVFTGDITRAIDGVGKIFAGLKGIVSNVLGALKTAIGSFLDWADQKTNGKISGIIAFARGAFAVLIDWLGTSFTVLFDSLEQVLDGLILFIAGVFTGNWEQAWNGVKKVFKGVINLMIGMIEAFINGFVSGINRVIDALNTIRVEIPDWVPGIGGKSFGINLPQVPAAQIPRLAQGAVIPPNREFMAVLGDQRSGNNLEAPEELIRQIVREEGGGSEVTVRFAGTMGQLVRVMKPYVTKEDRRRGSRLATGGV